MVHRALYSGRTRSRNTGTEKRSKGRSFEVKDTRRKEERQLKGDKMNVTVETNPEEGWLFSSGGNNIYPRFTPE